MYYENIMTEVDNLKHYLENEYKKLKTELNNIPERQIRVAADAEADTGRNLSIVFKTSDYKTLMSRMLTAVRNKEFWHFAIGDYIIVPSITYNGNTYTNWRFDLVGINTYNGVGGNTSLIPGLVFTSHKTTFNAVWPDVNNAYMDALANNIESNAGLTNPIGGLTGLNFANHYYGQQRQAEWIKNRVFLVAEQEIGNPQNTFTAGNANSCNMLPLFKRSPIYRAKESTPGTRNTWWTASRDGFLKVDASSISITYGIMTITPSLAWDWHSFENIISRVVPSFYL